MALALSGPNVLNTYWQHHSSSNVPLPEARQLTLQLRAQRVLISSNFIEVDRVNIGSAMVKRGVSISARNRGLGEQREGCLCPTFEFFSYVERLRRILFIIHIHIRKTHLLLFDAVVGQSMGAKRSKAARAE